LPSTRRLSPRRLATLAAATVLALGAPLLPGAASADVATDEVLAVPPSGAFAIEGRGYGHGHGMSQYGAEGAARQGLSAAQILAFYYPGTEPATSQARIAVLITADTTRDLKVRGGKGLSIRDRGTGRVRSLPGKAKYRLWKLDVRRGETALFWRNRGDWHRYRPSGIRHFRGDGEFRSTAHRLTLLTPSGARVYRGALRAARPNAASRDRDTVNVLGIDSYLRGVVPAEMPASWSPAAVQAQAVAARTYALFERAANLRRHYQICDTTACQVYAGVAGEHPLADRAIAATRGRYLRYDGAPAFTQFSASNGGWTSAGAQPYLDHHKDPYDRWSGNPYRQWSLDARAAVLERRYPELGELASIRIVRREGDGTWQGRVFRVVLTGSDGSLQISGDDFRFLYGLRSTWFRLTTTT